MEIHSSFYTVLLVCLVGETLAFNLRRSNNHLRPDIENTALLNEQPNEYQNELMMNNLLEEKDGQLRKALELALRLVDEEEKLYPYKSKVLPSSEQYLDSTLGEKRDSQENKEFNDVPFYLEHSKKLLTGDISNRKTRRHRKRSAFDSIAHRGSLGGFGQMQKQYKLAFTFENLLPYLLDNMRRNNRQSPSFN